MAAADTLMNRIREMIFSGELSSGERITEAVLALRLGVSRTPVRNALPSLAADGLLEAVGRRGFAIKDFSDAEAQNALELRALLEGQAARLIVPKGVTAALLADLDLCLAVGDELFKKRYLDRADEQEYGSWMVASTARSWRIAARLCFGP
jgi:GntR family transcriptional regulator of vanillate catabolism